MPDPAVEPRSFGERIAEISRRHGDPPVFASTETSIDALLEAGLGRAFATAAVLEPLRSKASLDVFARDSGLRTPRLLARTSAAGLADLEFDEPVVIKGDGPAGPLRGMQLAGDRVALRALSGRLPGELAVIVQEHVPGPQLSVAIVVAKDGELLARFQHAVERTWPIHGGATSRAVSQAPDAALVNALAGGLQTAGFWGLAQIDLVANRDGPVVLDVNPRFYGSMALATACGVNLPAAWHSAATGSPRPESPSYRYGVRFWWAEADIRALHRIRRPRGEHVGPLWQRGDLVAGALIQSAALAAEARARLR